MSADTYPQKINYTLRRSLFSSKKDHSHEVKNNNETVNISSDGQLYNSTCLTKALSRQTYFLKPRVFIYGIFLLSNVRSRLLNATVTHNAML